jgi:hypothetical protein
MRSSLQRLGAVSIFVNGFTTVHFEGNQALWDLVGLTAYMGSSNKMPIPVQVKPQTVKQTINPLETIRTPCDRFQFVIDSFDKAYEAITFSNRANSSAEAALTNKRARRLVCM